VVVAVAAAVVKWVAAAAAAVVKWAAAAAVKWAVAVVVAVVVVVAAAALARTRLPCQGSSSQAIAPRLSRLCLRQVH
jgi:hypothetical protein